MGLFKKKKNQTLDGDDIDDVVLVETDDTIRSNQMANTISPRQGYVFGSDYFEVDNRVGTIVSFFHNDGARDRLPLFWGVDRLTHNLDDDISVFILDTIERKDDSWVDEKQKTTEKVNYKNAQDASSSFSDRNKMQQANGDMDQISQELLDGATYLNVHMRMVVYAPDLASLDKAMRAITGSYAEVFGSIWHAAYTGAMRKELSTLFSPPISKRGKGFYFTSTEYAGSYNLVTHGFEDPAGEYVGRMAGDINNAAVLFDVDDYDKSVVIATDKIDTDYIDYAKKSLGSSRGHINSIRVSDMYASKLSQSALLNGQKVVHIVLNDANLDHLGPKFESITATIDLANGDLNMFELFGDVEDELSIFSRHINKLGLMSELIIKPNAHDAPIMRNVFNSVIADFYIDRRMWANNAKDNREKLRVVGLDHNQVPLLEVFVTYLSTKKVYIDGNGTPDEMRAINNLYGGFKALLDMDGDLFNTHTSPVLDDAVNGRRVVYNLAKLMSRSVDDSGVAMAQLVNVIDFALGNLDKRDVVIFHGAQLISKDPQVRQFLRNVIATYKSRGGRVVFSYDKVSSMLNNAVFCEPNSADYIVMSTLNSPEIIAYEQLIKTALPNRLKHALESGGQDDFRQMFIKRGMDNVVFYKNFDLNLV